MAALRFTAKRSRPYRPAPGRASELGAPKGARRAPTAGPYFVIFQKNASPPAPRPGARAGRRARLVAGAGPL